MTPTCPKCGVHLRLLRDYATLVHPPDDCSEAPDLAEKGRRLASQREDLIAAGVDPADLIVPLHPEPRDSQ